MRLYNQTLWFSAAHSPGSLSSGTISSCTLYTLCPLSSPLLLFSVCLPPVTICRHYLPVLLACWAPSGFLSLRTLSSPIAPFSSTKHLICLFCAFFESVWNMSHWRQWSSVNRKRSHTLPIQLISTKSCLLSQQIWSLTQFCTFYPCSSKVSCRLIESINLRATSQFLSYPWLDHSICQLNPNLFAHY